MTSLINIHSAKAYWSGSTTTVIFLFENTGTYGYSNIKIADNLGTVKATYSRCLQPRSVIKYFEYLSFPEKLTSLTLTSYRCNSDTEQNCSLIPVTCSNEVQSGINLNIPIADPWIRQTPSIPPNFIVTPMDSALRLVWDSSTGAEMFAYMIRVFQGTNIVLNAYTESTLRNITISGLINSTLYDIYVWGISSGNIMGERAIGQGTPQGTPPECPQLACELVINV